MSQRDARPGAKTVQSEQNKREDRSVVVNLKEVERTMVQTERLLKARQLALRDEAEKIDRPPPRSASDEARARYLAPTDRALAEAQERQRRAEAQAVELERRAQFARPGSDPLADRRAAQEVRTVAAKEVDRAQVQARDARDWLDSAAGRQYTQEKAREIVGEREGAGRRATDLRRQADALAPAINQAKGAAEQAALLQRAGYAQARIPSQPPANPAERATHLNRGLERAVQAVPPQRLAIARQKVLERGRGR